MSTRGVGTTSSMLLDTLVTISKDPSKPVYVIAHTRAYAMSLVTRLKGALVALYGKNNIHKYNINAMNMECYRKEETWRGIDTSKMIFVVDHHAVELEINKLRYILERPHMPW